MLTIIGCGNSNRSDDGVGVYIAQKLQAYLESNPLKSVKVYDAGTGGIDVMFQARGSSSLIIVDAGQTGSKPGTIYEVPGGELERKKEASYSLHDFRWDDAIYSGEKIFKDEFPKDIKVFLIEAESLELGLEMSDSVLKAAKIVISKIKTIAQNYD